MSTPAEPVAAPSISEFRVRLEVFEGPFDLLLGLISKHKLDVTEVALSKVTDDFIAHIKTFGRDWDLDQASGFLVVAATLLDLKAARLLPAADVDDEDDLELLEARDLLFARLLQYRAYKQVAALFVERLADEAKRHPRSVTMEPRFSSLLPELLLGLGPQEFAALAGRALAPRPVPTVAVDHVHEPLVSVHEQAIVMVDRLRRVRSTTFRSLTSDCPTNLYVVARFLALLELYRGGSVSFDQITPLGELGIRWTGTDEGGVDIEEDIELEDEIDAEDGTDMEPGTDTDTDSADAGSGADSANADTSTNPADPDSADPDSADTGQPPTRPVSYLDVAR